MEGSGVSAKGPSGGKLPMTTELLDWQVACDLAEHSDGRGWLQPDGRGEWGRDRGGVARRKR